MKYRTARNTLMRLSAKHMYQWWISQSPDSFSIRFRSAPDQQDFFIWSKKFNYNRDILIRGPKINRTVPFDSIYKIYPKELFNHRYGLCFELKNGSSFIVGE